MKIANLCRRDVAAVPIGASIEDVATLMCEKRVGFVVVTDGAGAGRRIAGIITDRDIVMAQLQHVASFSQINTSSVMTACPVLVHDDEDMQLVLRRMRDQGFRRAPVVNARRELIGVVSIDDLLSQLAKDIQHLAGIVERQRRP